MKTEKTKKCCNTCKKTIEAYEKINRIPTIPYKEYTRDGILTREFDKNVNELDLQWHFDEEDRIIKIVQSDKNWKFQFNNELPFNLNEGEKIKIKRNKYHRILQQRPNTNLIIEIIKL